MKELAEVSTSLQEEENKLDALPEDIEKMQKDTNAIAKEIWPIPVSADADQQIIDEADQLRLCAIEAIQGLIGSKK